MQIVERFLPLLDGVNTRYILVYGGRGSGKSFAVNSCLVRMLEENGYRILFTRWTLTSAADSIVPEFRQKIELLNRDRQFAPKPGGMIHVDSLSDILFRGIKTSSGNQTAKLKSLQGVNVWVLDEAEECTDEETFDKIDLSIRDTRKTNLVILVFNPSDVTHWIYKRFFEPYNLPQEFNGVAGDATFIHASFEQNLHNLPKNFLQMALQARAANPLKYRHVWRGHWLTQATGALWSYAMIQPYRTAKDCLPPMRRVIVAIDPAVTANANSDDTGIIVAGIGADGFYYVLEDLTVKANALQWAKDAIAAYRRHQADRIIGEVNNGGDLIEVTLRSVDKTIPYKAVHASRGKMIRAEPIAALYEQGLVRHAGKLDQLEAEMLTYSGKSEQASPNRLDALVWALTELLDNGACVAGAATLDDIGEAKKQDWEAF